VSGGLPYEGIRIVDFTQLEQGPSGTLMLADMGAEVIKVERIDHGEIGREQVPKHHGMSAHWAANNRNKLSISVDLKHPDGREVIERLIRSSDVVASNFRPGVMDRLGFGFGDARGLNPRIICAYASGYGLDGPYRDRRGQDLAAQAMGGVMDLTGGAENPPTMVGTFAIDYLGAMHFAIGIMAALAARDRTGEPQLVDSCLLNSAITLHHQEATAFLNTGQRYPRPAHGIAHAHNTPLYARYCCADGRWIVLIAEFYIDEAWQRLARALELSADVADDPRFQTVESVARNEEAASSILTAAIARFSRDEVMARLEVEDVLVAPVNDYEEVFSDPQVLHNQMVLTTERADVGTIRMVGMPVKVSSVPAAIRRPPPTVGEHNETVLHDLGYDDASIAALQASGAIGSEMVRTSAGGPPAWGG
jgi:formyl-CoA transferase